MTSPSQTELDRARKRRINSSHFDLKYIGEGGPIFIYQSCGFVSNKYRNGYDRIFGKQDMFKNLAKE